MNENIDICEASEWNPWGEVTQNVGWYSVFN